MHQADRVADWHKVPVNQLNIWQRIAVRTHGALTPGNLLSALGLVLVLWGLLLIVDQRDGWGLVVIGSGRLADILDGLVADRTGTKSPLGELVDTSFDKISVLVAAVVFIVRDFTPWWLVLAIALQNVASILASLLARLRHMALHPSRLGKNAMAGVWFTLLLFGIGHVVQAEGWKVAAWVILAAGYVAGVATLGLGVTATLSYYRQIMTVRPRTKK